MEEDANGAEPLEEQAAAGEAARERSTGGSLSAFAYRDYSLFWSGALVSNIGTWIQATALMWFIRVTYHSNAWVAAVNMANYIPVLLFVLFAGYLADSIDRKRIIRLPRPDTRRAFVAGNRGRRKAVRRGRRVNWRGPAVRVILPPANTPVTD
jgi:Transmembrane secretion effector